MVQQKEMWKDVMAAVTMEKDVREGTPMRGGSGRIGAVASEPQGQAMMRMTRVTGETHRRGRTQNGRCVTDD